MIKKLRLSNFDASDERILLSSPANDQKVANEIWMKAKIKTENRDIFTFLKN